jgi:hypothetical protein
MQSFSRQPHRRPKGEQMAEQMEAETQQQGSQGAGPLLLSTAAAAAAGALAVVVQKALSGRGGERAGGESGSGESGSSDSGTSFDDVEKVADDLEGLVDELRSESRSGPDFQRLVEIADTISEYADQAADAFNAARSDPDAEGKPSERRVTDELMSRIREISTGAREKAGSGG